VVVEAIRVSTVPPRGATRVCGVAWGVRVCGRVAWGVSASRQFSAQLTADNSVWRDETCDVRRAGVYLGVASTHAHRADSRHRTRERSRLVSFYLYLLLHLRLIDSQKVTYLTH
jgi:hypothetical protein